ncbi:MAG: hypothetical protein JWN04_1323 [Myxococcaceae bacterium]|nr:hypothetical protein [Myxococcaceae bacterium]
MAEPNWAAWIDFEARLGATPAKVQVRGMFLQLLVQSLAPELAARHETRRYVAFKNYPMREYIELLALGCASSSARKPPAERVRELGFMVYPNYAATMTGMAIFAVAGHDFRRVLELCPAAYRIATEDATVTIRSIEDGHALIELRNLWNLPDLHQVGIFEGAMKVCRAVGKVGVRAYTFGDADLEISWSPDPSAARPAR